METQSRTVTHYQVYDTRTKHAVAGAVCMEYETLADTIAFQLNLKSRTKDTRYIVRKVDPNNLPIYGA